MRIRQAVAGTHAGAVRTFNEDAVLRLGRVPLYAIADGMGGPEAGDVAAQLTLDVIKRHAMAIRDLNATLAKERSAENRRAMQRSMDSLFNRASQAIREEAARRGKSVMGASVVLCTIADEYAYIAHVGDARAYLLRAGSLQRLTEDHTLAELKLRRGRITRAEYENHPERHVLYQSLGAPFELDVDLAEVRLEDGDVLLMCSDGVIGALDDAKIAADLDPWDLNGSLRGVLRACIQARCADNISAVMLGMEGETRTETVRPVEDPTQPTIPQPNPAKQATEARALSDATPLPSDAPTAVDEPPSSAPSRASTPAATSQRGANPDGAATEITAAALVVRGTLFTELSEAERTALSPYLEERTYNAGERIVAVGDPADRAVVLVSGSAFVTCQGLPMGEVSDGVLCGLAFDGRGLSALQAVARAPTTVLSLTRARYDELLGAQPPIAAKLAMGLADAERRLASTLAERLAGVERALKGRS